ncbi:MAG: UDP-3-O-(3-hydroxymyristoyl)glucosamine N-acyltransferase [Nitrospinae bacterium]|nr:UDP-3-O-(3-hydroxymyristoyl)glucosamine N-acyltransferase [Nitrospinota bacterium]
MNTPPSDGISLKQLAGAITAKFQGPGDLLITGVNSPEGAEPGEIAYLAGERYLETAQRSRASAFIVSKPFQQLRMPQLIVSNPQYAFVQIINRFFPQEHLARGIAKDIWQGEDVRIGRDVSIGPFVTLSDRANIGDRVTLYPGVFIGANVKIGDDSMLYPGVTILDRCEIGAHVIIHAGTVIGSDGFGYLQHGGQHHKIPQRGTVVIENEVELGANVTIDRATFGRTLIKRGTKIDNLVQIAHNVTIGDNSIVIALVGIAGSTTIGQQVMIGGQSGLVDHLTVGDHARIAAGSSVLRNVEAGTTVGGGIPALPAEAALRRQILIDRLPELRQELTELVKRVQAIEGNPRTAKTRKTKKS